jgi:hypothetical protein
MIRERLKNNLANIIRYYTSKVHLRGLYEITRAGGEATVN